MRTYILESKSHPVICVDVQPEYANYGNNAKKCKQIIDFVVNQTGPVLMFVNAEDTGVSGDTIADIKAYWETTINDEQESQIYDEDMDDYVDNPDFIEIDWSRFEIIDKGFGYLRSWHDNGIDDATIIKAIRLMYQERVSDSRELFGGEDSEEYESKMEELLGAEVHIGLSDPILVNWVSVKKLRQYAGAYVVGGGRNECLWEIRILMNAFNIRAKLIDSLIY